MTSFDRAFDPLPTLVVPSRANRRPPLALLLLGALLLVPCALHAAPGDVIFEDDFEGGFGGWTTTEALYSNVNEMTSDSGSRSLYLRGDTVTTTSPVIDARVSGIRVQMWIRTGDDAFSEDPNADEDLHVEYLRSDGIWASLGIYPGSGTPGEIARLDQILSPSALHAGFRIRFTLTRGSGGPPQNNGTGWDYFHIDDVVVSEVSPPPPLGIGTCEEFTNGLSNWTIAADRGQVTNGIQTSNTPPRSLVVNGGTASATSSAIDLAGASGLSISLWLRRGSDSFSEDPDRGEDLYVEYFDDGGRWQQLARYAGEGTPGQIYTPRFPLPPGASHRDFKLRFRMTGNDGPEWDYWHIDSVCLAGKAELAQWRFEEPSWNGTAGEVLDESAGNHDGTALGNATTQSTSPAIDGSPGTCRYASFVESGAGIEIPHHDDLNGTNALTQTFWLNPASRRGNRHLVGKQILGSQGQRAQMGVFAASNWLYGRAITRNGTQSIRTPLPPLGQWSHIALVFDGTSLTLYTNGTTAARTTFAATTLVENARPIAIGRSPGSSSSSFEGFIDEVHFYGTALGASEIVAVMNETHDCSEATIDFAIRHDGAGVNCEPETVSVVARDLNGQAIPDYDGAITLDTQTGTGTWGLVRGGGLFADAMPDDGMATYTFAAADGGEAEFALTYVNGPQTIDVDVYSGTSRDDDSEGTLVFAPGSLLMTAAAVPSPPPAPLSNPLTSTTAGKPFEVHLTAYGASANSGSCGVIETYDGNKSIRFWVDHRDPGTAPLVPTLDRTTISSSEAGSRSQTVRFSRGRAVVVAKYKDVGRIALEAVDDTGVAPIRGASGAFVSKPADFAFVSITNGDGEDNPGVSTPTGTPWARAGEAFAAVVEVRDAEGSATPSFGRESVAEGLRLESAALVAPAGGRNGTADDGAIANATDFAATNTPGRFEGSAFAFDEVGAIRLRARVADGDYLGTGSAEGSPSNVVGRFAPSRFEITANTPRFRTACSLGAFTWMGQPFRYAIGEEPVLAVRAVNAAGTTTTNYAGAWWRITNDSLDNRAYRSSIGNVDESRLPAASTDPKVVSNDDGTGTLTFASGGGIALERTTPTAPFDAEIELGIDVLDEDGTAYALNPFVVGGTASGSGIAFDVAKRFQFGRVAIDNAHGSELVDLAMSLRAQHFDGAVFVDDDNDSCSRIPEAALMRTASPASLGSTPTIQNDPLLSGDSGLIFSAPGEGGTVDIRVDLGTSGANLPWLRYDWPEDGNLDGLLDDDPRARVTFGIWEGRDRMIFTREMY